MTTSPSSRRVDRRARLDIGIRIILALLFALFSGFYLQNALEEFRKLDPANIDIGILVHGLSILAVMLYTFMLACVYALRLKPTNAFAGIWPTTAAILGGFLILAVTCFRQRTDLPLGVQIGAGLLIFVGEGLTAFVLAYLGRSFSILPESRRLVTSGPYRWVRHPLYVAEALATIGVLINFLGVWTALLIALQLMLQFVRMHYEEQVLRANFPDYEDYARRTARLIPGVY
ncbi:MAG: isoprenylcysteine carboxylmethyltransferase family protein [Pseudomonadota bacterium]|nr:isoprenylcysteine carboxylmethyltransferase family protein [Pseudomonadota bacterium]